MFSAANDGNDAVAGKPLGTIGAPATAKNVITVGAAESVRASGTDGCGVADTGANSARDLIGFSSRGPTDDGRLKPDVVAPGTHVTGAQPQHAFFTATGVCTPNFVGTKYSLVSGTSQAAPNVTGLAALVRDWYQRTVPGGAPPSPAMTKALISSEAVSMAGGDDGQAGTLAAAPDQHQGWGRVSLAGIVDGPAREFRDQLDVLSASGSGTARSYAVDDPARPVRVSLAWTDAPGPTTGNAFVNNLDLRVTAADGTVYAGNQIAGGASIPDPTQADPRNNLEQVILPAGVAGGSFTVRVNGTSIAGDGLPGNGDLTDQDFALVVTNANEEAGTAVVRSDGTTVQERGDGDGALEAGEGFEVEPRLVNVGTAATGVTGTLTGPAGATIYDGGSAGWGTLTPGGSGGPDRPVLGRVPAGAGCPGSLPLTLTLATSAGAVDVPVALPLGRAGTVASLPAGGQLIPDGAGSNVPGAAAVSTVDVTGGGTVEDIDVAVDIRHTFIGDLEIVLESPAGTEITLALRPGGANNSGNNVDAVFDDEASAGIPGPGTFSLTGRVQPAEALSALDGQPLAGTWRLEVRDFFAADPGTLNGWSTRRPECDAAPAATPPSVTVSGPDTVAAGGTAEFTATATDASGITRVDWDTDADGAFDDGTGNEVDVSFPAAGTRQITARALDGFLVAGQGTKSVTVPGSSGGDPPAGDPPAGDPPAGDPPGGNPPGGEPAPTVRPSFASFTRRARVNRRRRFAYSFTTDRASTGRLTFTASFRRRTLRLGSVRFTATAPGRVTVRLRLSARHMAALRRARRLRVNVSLTPTGFSPTRARLTLTR